MERCEASDTQISAILREERGIYLLDQEIEMPRGSRRDSALYSPMQPEKGNDVLEIGFNFGGDSDLFAQLY